MIAGVRHGGRALVAGALLGMVAAACGHARQPPPAPAAPAAARSEPAAAPVAPAAAPVEPPPAPRPAVAPEPAPPAVALPPAPPAASHSVPAFAVTPEGLKPGAVKMIQQRLENAGSLRAQEESGQLDAVTRSALERFQDANELPATGEPDEATIRKLGLEPRNIFEPAPGSTE
jgi:hypothetical protein